MPTETIAAGRSKTITIPAYARLVLSGSGTVRLTRGDQQRTAQIGTSRTLGPYAVEAQAEVDAVAEVTAALTLTDSDADAFFDSSGTALVRPDGSNQYVEVVRALSASTSVLPVAAANLQAAIVSLDANAVFTFPTTDSGTYTRFRVTLKQAAALAWMSSFPSSVSWTSGTNPQPPVTSGDFATYEFLSNDGGATWMGTRLTAVVAPLAFDRFTRADSASSLGTAETGGAWTAHTGTWGISSNQAYLPTRSGDSVASVSVTSATHSVFCDVVFGTSAAQPGIVARVVDDQNFWLCLPSQPVTSPRSLAIWKRVAGAYTNVGLLTNVPGASTGWTVGQSYRLGITCSGNVISVYADGVFVQSVTDASLNTATRAGLRHNDTTTGNLWDNFVAI